MGVLLITFSLELKRMQHLRKDLQVAQVSIYYCEIISLLLIHSKIEVNSQCWWVATSLVFTPFIRLIVDPSF